MPSLFRSIFRLPDRPLRPPVRLATWLLRAAHRADAAPLALAVCALLSGTPAVAAERVTLMTGGASKIIYLPITLAARLGYFRDEGLDVEIRSEPTGIDTATELIAGAIQGAIGFYDHTIDLQSRGQDVEAIVVFGRAVGLAELASSRSATPVQSIAGLRGRRLGVSGFGASTYFMSRYLAQRAGLAANAYTVVPIGSDSGFADALQRGTIDAGMVEEPTVSALLSSGAAHLLVDLRDVDGTRATVGGPYAGACLYVQRRWVDTHEGEARRLARALVRTLGFIATHRADEIAAQLPAGFVGADRRRYVDALAAALPSFSRDGRMPDGAPDTVLRVLASVDPAVFPSHVDLTRTYTNRFADQAATARGR